MENIITDVIKIAVATFFSLIRPTFAGWLNERSKRVQSAYLRKEEKYIQLIKSLEGFYESSRNRDLINQFLLELKLCWLYCPDDVISWRPREYPEIDYTYCKGCGICASVCPVNTIEMVLEGE